MPKNVANVERIASLVLGGLSLKQSLKRQRSPITRLASGGVGAALVWRGLTGHCAVYDQLGWQSRKGSASSMPSSLFERSTLVNLPIEELRSFLEIEETPYGQFDSTATEDDYQITIDDHQWILSLTPHADQERTLIKASWMDRSTPSTSIEAHRNSNKAPTRMLNLRALKSLMETGEIASIEGQPHGERSGLGKFAEQFSDFIFETIQSKTALPQTTDPTNTFVAAPSPPQRKAHA